MKSTKLLTAYIYIYRVAKMYGLYGFLSWKYTVFSLILENFKKKFTSK